MVEKIHLLHLGGREEAAVFFEGMRKPDPIHRFNTFPARHLLHYVQMKEYPVLFLRYVDVESTEAMVRYLLEGGFGVVDGGQLGWLEVQLRREVGERVERIEIGLEHPLFNAYFEIDRYKMQSTQCGKGSCSSVRPTPGLEVDGRLIAVAGLPRFNGKCDCLSNRLYVNILVYGLIQPSPMGGRYLARSPG